MILEVMTEVLFASVVCVTSVPFIGNYYYLEWVVCALAHKSTEDKDND
jgi:hypothetical protein